MNVGKGKRKESDTIEGRGTGTKWTPNEQEGSFDEFKGEKVLPKELGVDGKVSN